MTIHQNIRTTVRACVRATALGLVLIGSSSCNTEVTNPGPVKDDFLFDRNAATAMVNGSGRALAQAINWIGYTGAAVTREIHPAGSTGSFGITNRWQRGELSADDGDLNTHWEQAQRARWVAEEAVRRLEAPATGTTIITPVQYANALQLAYLYAGFANRVLGEHMCEAVIDGSGILANSIFFTHAESLFTKAIAVTGGTAATMTLQSTAATAGRASARMYLGNWAGAIADAATVPTTHTFNVSYFNIGEDAQRNRIFYASGNTRESGSAYRAHTQWSTWHMQYKYGSSTTLTAAAIATPVMNDPRISIVTSTQPLGDAAIDCCGRVPFFPEAKHTSSASPIRLSSGREMLLIRAEERLVAGDMATGMTHLNAARTAAGAPTITATDLTDAWRLLKRERGIELWLEARRLGDFRRWAADNRPGALDALETPGPNSHLQSQSLCFPVSRSERDTNGNIP